MKEKYSSLPSTCEVKHKGGSVWCGSPKIAKKLVRKITKMEKKQREQAAKKMAKDWMYEASKLSR